jgi:hypothetical protein
MARSSWQESWPGGCRNQPGCTRVVAGLASSILVAFPTGDDQGKLVSKHRPVTLAAMEGLFESGPYAGFNLMILLAATLLTGLLSGRSSPRFGAPSRRGCGSRERSSREIEDFGADSAWGPTLRHTSRPGVSTSCAWYNLGRPPPCCRTVSRFRTVSRSARATVTLTGPRTSSCRSVISWKGSEDAIRLHSSLDFLRPWSRYHPDSFVPVGRGWAEFIPGLATPAGTMAWRRG